MGNLGEIEKLQSQPSPVARQREAVPGWDPCWGKRGSASATKQDLGKTKARVLLQEAETGAAIPAPPSPVRDILTAG